MNKNATVAAYTAFYINATNLKDIMIS